ncbi:MAG: gamma carbonic anhydrase family protein [Hyphomicrobiaceae bacterium]
MPLYTLDENKTVVTPAEGSYWVAPNAAVIGLVELAEDASVWFGATIRGDTELISIGPRSNIQDNCVLHTDPTFPLTVEAECTVGHSAILHGCHIGARCLIGMGATVLNGAKIGEESLIGANALIPEGKEIAPRSMVLGSPGRIVRTLSDADVAAFAASSAQYVARWKRFHKTLKVSK